MLKRDFGFKENSIQKQISSTNIFVFQNKFRVKNDFYKIFWGPKTKPNAKKNKF